MKRASVLLIIVALISVLVSCVVDPDHERDADADPPVSPELTTTHYVTLDLLVAIFLDVTQDGTRYDLVGVDLSKVYTELEKARRFFWVHSHCKLNLNFTFLTIDEPISFSGWWLGPGDVNPILDSTLESVEQSLSDYDSLVAIWASPGYNPDEEDPPGYVGGGGAAVYRHASFTLGGSICWLMVHEFHHCIDEFFHLSGHPDYPHADNPWMLEARFGDHFDFNAYILRTWPAERWLELRELPDFSPKIVETADRDGDGIPDDDPTVPIDERRFGSDPRLVDTDGDGLTDLEELMAGLYSASDPNAPDTDGDGLIDGVDPYPLYPLNPRVPKNTITIDAELESKWHFFTSHLQHVNTDFNASIYLSWDDEYLYIGLEIDNFAGIHIYVDANADGWYHGKDNYEISVDPSYENPLFVVTSARIWDCSHATTPSIIPDWNESIIAKEDIKRAARRSGSGYAVKLAIPRNAETGLVPREGVEIGLRFEFDYIGRDGKFRGTSFEQWSFVYIALDPAR